MKFLREMISRKSDRGTSTDDNFGFQVPEEDQETLRGLRERLAEAPVIVADIEDDVAMDEDALAEDEVFDEDEDDILGDEDWDEDFEEGFEEEVSDDIDEDIEPEMESADVQGDEITNDPEDETEVTEIASESAVDTFEDIPEEISSDAMPELSQEDIQRAMKLRKKMWSDIPDDNELAGSEPPPPPPIAAPTKSDLESYRPASRAVTRPVTRPVSRPFREVSDARAAKPEALVSPGVVAADDWVIDEESQDQDQAIDNKLDQDRPGVELAAVSHGPQAVLEEPKAPIQDKIAAKEEPVEDDHDDGATIQSLMAAAAAAKTAEPKFEEFGESGSNVQVPAPAAGRAGRGAGRVKTRLLGFQADDGAEDDIFDAEKNKPGQPDQFPVGWIVVIEGPGRGASISLRVGVSLIGRGEDQAVRLNFGDSSISRDNHASIAFDDEMSQFFLGHGGKSNIVRLNNKPVLSTEELSNGDIIRIGETTLRFVSLCGSDFSWTEDHGGEVGRAATA